MFTVTYEPLRPIYAPDDSSAYFYIGLFCEKIVHQGEGCTRSYWLVPVC